MVLAEVIAAGELREVATEVAADVAHVRSHHLKGDSLAEGVALEGDDGGVAEPWRVALAFLLCVGFGVGALGHGPPFWLGAGLFLFLAIILFEYPDHKAAGTLRYGIIRAALVGAIGAAAITFIFQEIFLVRLP